MLSDSSDDDIESQVDSQASDDDGDLLLEDDQLGAESEERDDEESWRECLDLATNISTRATVYDVG